MINSLKVATDGYLKRNTKTVLIIAVAGYLNLGGSPNPPIPPSLGLGGGGSQMQHTYQSDQIERIKKYNLELMMIAQMFIKKLS